MSLTPKERLLRVLRKEPVDRPPVICTGGMMNAAIVEIMEQTGHKLPEAHSDPARMAELAQDIHAFTGFENIGVPFCVTVEAEQLGSQVDLGTLACEPKIVREIFPCVRQVVFHDLDELIHRGRAEVVVRAALRAAAQNPDVPVVASLTGPISAATSIIDPMTFYKELRRFPDDSHRVLDYVTRMLSAFAKRLAAAGVTAIAIGDPSATGEILGPAMFEQYALRYLNQLIDQIHEVGVPVILHICGDIKRVRHLLPRLHSNALSTDAMVSLARLKEDFPGITTMGNLSTFTLQWKKPDEIHSVTKTLIESGIDIISPACGLSTSTTLANVRALTAAVTEGDV